MRLAGLHIICTIRIAVIVLKNNFTSVSLLLLKIQRKYRNSFGLLAQFFLEAIERCGNKHVYFLNEGTSTSFHGAKHFFAFSTEAVG